MNTIKTNTLPVTELSIDRLIEIYAQAADRINQAISNLTEKELLSKPRGENTWSIFDIICHLADSEAIGFTRIQKIYVQDTTEALKELPRMTLYNQNQWIENSPYSNEFGFLGTKLALFKSLRESNALLFRQCQEQDWLKEGYHEEYGCKPLRFFLELYTKHGELHLSQIITIRTLIGKPLELESLI